MFYSATKPGGIGAVPPPNSTILFALAWLITLNLDHLVSCFCLFYVKDCRLTLANDGCIGAFSGIGVNVLVKIFWGKLPDPFCCLHGILEDIGSIVANVESMVIKTLLIGAPKLLPYPVCPIGTLFICRCSCHTHQTWLPPCLLKADLVTSLMR